MGIMAKIKLFCAKVSGKVVTQLSKIGPGQGRSIPGRIFHIVGGDQSVSYLASDIKLGSVLVTGTNGKTTTTKLLVSLMSKDIQIRKSFENNTINSLITATLNQKGDLGVFEYGIRNIRYGIPDKVQKLFNPIGVVYTTISQEHTVVNNVRNPFSDYIEAKKLLSKGMDHGVVVANCDDPYTAFIGVNKEEDIPVNYFGFDEDLIDLDNKENLCPNCSKPLVYSKRFLGHRGIYSCQCGFKRPEPNVRLTNLELNDNDHWDITIVGDVYNYFKSENVQFDINLTVPPFGAHNLYNTLAAITAYVTFTPKLDNIEKNIKDVFNNLTMAIIPPGRFEVMNYNDKCLGIGQGDNGDAMRMNGRLMGLYVDGPVELIYTTPDELEDDIFNDHLHIIKLMNPDHIIVVPGRKSVEKAEEYYNIIKKEFESAEFIPMEYNLDERSSKVTDLAKNSKYDYVIVTGCGEEIAFWERIKRNFK